MSTMPRRRYYDKQWIAAEPPRPRRSGLAECARNVATLILWLAICGAVIGGLLHAGVVSFAP